LNTREVISRRRAHPHPGRGHDDTDREHQRDDLESRYGDSLNRAVEAVVAHGDPNGDRQDPDEDGHPAHPAGPQATGEDRHPEQQEGHSSSRK
jgi:hypothetical protein